MAEANEERVREAVGVFDDAESFQEAVDDLLNAGFDRAEISLLASEHAVAEKLGHLYRKVEELEDDSAVPRAVYVSPEAISAAKGAVVGTLFYVAAGVAAGAVLASGGTVLAAFVAQGLAGGAAASIGAVLAGMIGRHHAEHVRTQIEHGGLLLWVNARTPARERVAVDILRRHSAHDVHVHSIG